MNANIKHKGNERKIEEATAEKKFPEFKTVEEIFGFVEEEAQRRFKAEKNRVHEPWQNAVSPKTKTGKVDDPLASCDEAIFDIIKRNFSEYPARRIPRFLVFKVMCSHHITKKELSVFLARLDSKGLIRSTNYGIEILNRWPP